MAGAGRSVAAGLVSGAVALGTALTGVISATPAQAAPTPTASPSAPATPRAEPPASSVTSDGKKYNLVWNDEFDGNSLGPDWAPGTEPENGSMKYVNKMDPKDPARSNIVVKDGKVTLRAFPDGSYGGKYKVSSGNIQTAGKKSWKFGHIETRMKMPTEKGMWPAFWMMPDQNPYGWPRDGEIDWIEYPRSADPRQNQTVLHTSSQYSPRDGGDSATTGFYTHPTDLANEWHDYAMDWTPEGFVFYIDGKEYSRKTVNSPATPNEWREGQANSKRWDSSWKNDNGSVHQDTPNLAPFDKDFYLIFNLGVKIGQGWASAPDGYQIDPAKSGVEMDYVRVYQTDEQVAQQNTKFVKFDTAGQGADIAPRAVKAGETVDLPTPVAPGKVFDGWYADPRFKQRKVTSPLKITDDTTLIATWRDTAERVTVTFDNGGHGGEVTPMQVPPAGTVALPTPQESGWVFEGWYTDAARTQKAPAPFTTDKDVTLYAKWSESSGPRVLTDVGLDGGFKGNDYVPTANDVVSGTVSRRGKDELPVRSGVVVHPGPGQYTSQGGVVATIDPSYPISTWKYSNNPFVAEADFDLNDQLRGRDSGHPPTLLGATGNIRVYLDGGRLCSWMATMGEAADSWSNVSRCGADLPVGPHRLSMAYLPTENGPTTLRVLIDGTELPVLESPTPAVGNTTFAGQDIVFGNSSNRHESQPYSAAITLDRLRVATTTTKGFTPAEMKLQPVKVSFNASGHGPDPTPITAQLGDKVDLPTPAPVPGWRFDGWFADQAFTKPVTSPLTVNEATTLYAKWTQTATVTFNTGGHGKQPDPATVPVGQPLQLPALSEPGSTFIGWFADQELTRPVANPLQVSGDTTLFAKWYAATATCNLEKPDGAVPGTVKSGNKAYDLVWQEEFCGNQLDKSRWKPGNEPENGAMKYLNAMGNPDNSKNNIFLDKGALNLHAIPLTDQQKKQYPGKLAASGLINNQGIDSWKYGRFEARLKSPDQQGFWPALWMMPDKNPYGWPKDGEIDWFETIGRDKQINHTSLQTSSFPERTWREGQWKTNPVEYTHSEALGNKFHDYAMEWEPGVFRFYFDNKPVGTLTKWENSWVREDGTRYEGPLPEPFDKRFYFIANLGVVGPGGWGDAPDGSTDWMRNFQIDYLRVYQTADQRAGENDHYLKFDNLGFGQQTPSRTVKSGTRVDTLPVLSSPERGEFGGWFFDRELTRPATAPLTITDDTTLFAKWPACEVGAGDIAVDARLCLARKNNPWLGKAIEPVHPVAGGVFQKFAGGSLYWSPTTGAQPVTGAIFDTWGRFGWEWGKLGYPTAPEKRVGAGFSQTFERGTLYWSPATGGHPAWGELLGAFKRQGETTGILGFPTSDEVCNLKGGGCYQNFEHGATIWSPKTGAYFSRGLIREKWASLGFENGPLGYPTSDEVCGIRDGGCYQNFQGGAILWSARTGAHTSWGATRAEYARVGFENSPLGLPTTDDVCGIKYQGCYQNFQGGAILWSARTGAHQNWGAIRDRYAALGFERGPLGMPASAETCGQRDGGCSQRFEGGTIHWSPTSGSWSVRGAIADHWRANGAQDGRFGYPTSDEQCSSNGGPSCSQQFQSGRIEWNPRRGAWG